MQTKHVPRRGSGGRIGFSAVLWLFALFIAAFVLWPVAAKAQSATTANELRNINFEGAVSFPEELLRAAIHSSETRCRFIVVCWFGIGEVPGRADPIELRADVIRLRVFYYERGFRETRVTLDSARISGAMHVTFRVDEGQPVRVADVELSGIDQVDGSAQRGLQRVLASLPLRAGEPLSLLALEATRDSITSRLQNLGYGRAEVFAGYLIPRDTPHVAHVTYEIAPGSRVYFSAPEITGTSPVSERIVRRFLTFEAGDEFSLEKVLNSQRTLYNLELFRNVEIRPDLSRADSIVPVTVRLDRGDVHRFRAGLGLSTSEFVNAEGRWVARNFMGGARRLEVRARVYNVFADQLHSLPGFESSGDPYNNLSGSVTGDFTQPWFFGRQNTLGAGIFVERRSLPDIFVRTARGGYVSLTRSLGAATTASVAYRPEITRLDAADLIFCVSFTACDAEQIRVLREPHRLAPLVLTFGFDRSNSLFAPTRGHVVRIDAEYASPTTGSEFSYTRLIGEWTRYGEPFRGLVFASRLRAGIADALENRGSGLGVHPQKRFFAGGSNSVRGFGQYQLGPKLLTIDPVDELIEPSDTTVFKGCTAQAINAGSCNVGLLAEETPGIFDTRAVGGAAVLEGNLEIRFPVYGDNLRGAAFLDFGQVWSTATEARLKDIVFTPGFGLRYFSAIGPVRIDVAYNPQSASRVSILTTKVCDKERTPCTPETIVDGVTYTAGQLRNTRELVSLGSARWGASQSWRDRLQLHFSIGQAF